jgi:hypothetical protein
MDTSASFLVPCDIFISSPALECEISIQIMSYARTTEKARLFEGKNVPGGNALLIRESQGNTRKENGPRNTVITRMQQLQRLSNRREAGTSPTAFPPSLASMSSHTPRQTFLGEQVSLQGNSRYDDRKGRRYKFFESTVKFAIGLALLSLRLWFCQRLSGFACQKDNIQTCRAFSSKCECNNLRD